MCLPGELICTIICCADVNPAIELEEVVNSTEKSHASVATVDKKMIRLNKKLLAEARKKQ